MACPPISRNARTAPNASPIRALRRRERAEAFGGGLAEEPSAPDAKCGPDGVLLLAAESAQKKQCSDVAAGDQEYERGGAEQRQQDALAVAVVFGGEQLDVGREAGEVAISLGLPRGE